MTGLARAFGAVNLGQGFPDFEGPDELKRLAKEAIDAGHNQYAPCMGISSLRDSIAKHRSSHYGLEYDPEQEVLVTTGATEAIAASLLTLCEAGDEVVYFDPAYDGYAAAVALAGATSRTVPLRGARFALDVAELEAAFGPATRAIIVNSPHNPTGKVFSTEELDAIARLCVEHDVIAITDEVYEHLVYRVRHTPLASRPGMRSRTLMISSTGKTFSFTGWKIGFCCGPPELIAATRTCHQVLTFTSGTPFQHAMAHAMRSPKGFFERLAAEYRMRRDRLVEGLDRVGFGVTPPDGTYFVCADIRPLGFDDDVALCRRLPEAIGVAAIPCSAFFADPDAGRHLVRFAFCKTDRVLDEGLQRLARGIPAMAR